MRRRAIQGKVRDARKSREPIIRSVPRKQEPAAEEAGSKSARTRERILDAAAHVLSRKGYAGTRLAMSPTRRRSRRRPSTTTSRPVTT